MSPRGTSHRTAASTDLAAIKSRTIFDTKARARRLISFRSRLSRLNATHSRSDRDLEASEHHRERSNVGKEAGPHGCVWTCPCDGSIASS